MEVREKKVGGEGSGEIELVVGVGDMWYLG